MNLKKIEELIKSQEAELKERTAQNAEPSNLAFLKLSIEHLKRIHAKGESNPVDVFGIIKKLKEMDLTKLPYQEVRPLIGQLLSMFPVMITFLYPENASNPADSFIRARPYRDGEPQFTTPSQLSFKPQEYNKTFQRASTPNQTMFYGCLKRLNNQELKVDNRLVASLESLRMLTAKDSKGMKKVAYGKWIVTEQINVVTILNKDNLKSEDPAIRKLYQDFIDFSKNMGMEEEGTAISDFISERFSDENAGEGKEHLYMLSAMFAEAFVSDLRMDGVLYPSVRSAKEGICVALTKRACSKLKLKVAGESNVYKGIGEAIVDNHTCVLVDDGATSYTMQPVEAKYIMGDAEVMKRLKISSLSELV